MRSTSGTGGWKFSLTTLGVVMLVVACSPNGKKTAITPRSPGAFQEKVSSCTDRLRDSEKLKLGAKNKVVVCEIPEGQAQAVPVSYPVSFSVQKGLEGRKSSGDDVRLAMTVGFETEEKMTEEAREKWRSIFANVCGGATSEIFSRSRLSSFKLHMNLKFVFADPDGGVFDDEPSDETGAVVDEPDQILHVKKSAQGGDELWTLDRLPSRPSFYPLGKKADGVACKAKFPGADADSVKAFRECARQRRALVNAPACAAFAKRVGNLLGIVDAEKEAATCGAVQPSADASQNPAAAKPKPRPTEPGGSSSFAKPRTSDEDFMAKAELNRGDLLTILSPVCPDQL